MRKLFILFLLLSFPTLAEHRPEIHCKHFVFGYPYGSPFTNDLIIRDLYAMSNNDSTKLADWIAYKIDLQIFEGPSRSRKWAADPWLDENETLEPDDYKGANEELKVDRGHQAPLANFKGSDKYYETNYLSNITPQKSELNQGPWRILEERERTFAENYPENDVYVMTGPIYNHDNQLCLPKADEPHLIPVAYWRIIVMIEGNEIKTAAFLLPQETPRNADFIDYIQNIDTIEFETGLDFLWELEDKFEEQIESETNKEWIINNFSN